MTVVEIYRDVDSVYQRLKSTIEMDTPLERLLGAIIIRAVVDYFDPKYREDVEQFFQVGLGSYLDVDWTKTLQTIRWNQ